MSGWRSLEVRTLTFFRRVEWDGAGIGSRMAKIIEALCDEAASPGAMSEVTMAASR